MVSRTARRLSVALVAAALAAALALTSCAHLAEELPIPGRMAPVESDRERGFAFDREAQKQLPMIHDLEVLEFVDDLGQRLVRSLGDQPFEYRFRVIVDPEPNAFAVPGGYVYIHSGTILDAGSIDELAGVMAHELGHVKGRHAARMAKETAIPNLLATVAGIAAAAATKQAAPIIASQAANVAIQLQYSRKYEDEADRMGVDFMSHAGFDPEGMVRFFERIEADEKSEPQGHIPPYLYSHPAIADRIQTVQGLVASNPPVGKPPADLVQRFPEIQARLDWLVRHQRDAYAPVAAFDQSAIEPLLAKADRQADAGRPGAALETLQQAEAIQPLDPSVPYRRAVLLEKLGRTSDAIAAYRRAVHLDPNQAAVLLALGRLYEATGQRREALFFLEQASYRTGPSTRTRTQVDGEIERLTFPVLDDSGFALPGVDPVDAAAQAAPDRTDRPTLAAGARSVAWWGRLGPHWTGSAPYFQVRWVDPAGHAGKAKKPDRKHDVLYERHRFASSGPAPGPWAVEVLYGGEVVHRDVIQAGHAP
jgi:predicted Zn-dependent protease